jgi:hypothetical protein
MRKLTVKGRWPKLKELVGKLPGLLVASEQG